MQTYRNRKHCRYTHFGAVQPRLETNHSSTAPSHTHTHWVQMKSHVLFNSVYEITEKQQNEQKSASPGTFSRVRRDVSKLKWQQTGSASSRPAPQLQCGFLRNESAERQPVKETTQKTSTTKSNLGRFFAFLFISWSRSSIDSVLTSSQLYNKLLLSL